MTQDPAWIVFLASSGAVVAGVGAWFWRLERPGLEPGKGPLTLSWTLRRWLGVRPRTRRWFWAVPLFVALCAAVAGGASWLAVHIVFG